MTQEASEVGTAWMRGRAEGKAFRRGNWAVMGHYKASDFIPRGNTAERFEGKSDMIHLTFNEIASGCCVRIDCKGPEAEVARPARGQAVVVA